MSSKDKEIDSSKLAESNEESENKTNKEIQSENGLENSKNNIKLIEDENTSEDPYIKYITQIEQLQNELQLEKSISNSIRYLGVSGEDIIKLKNELMIKEEKLNQLKQTNKKQEEALNELRKKISKEISKNNKSHSQNNYKNNKNIKQNEAINIVLKIKERELNDAIQKMNSLKKENQLLKTDLYNNDNYSKKVEVIDISKEYDEKIKELNIELKLLNKQLVEHKICIEEQNKINNEYKELKKKLKELKNDTNENKNKIKDFEFPTYLNTEPNDQNLLGNRLFNKKKRSDIPQSEKKLNNMSTLSASRNNNIILPPISTPRKSSQNKNYLNINNEQSILTNDFIEKVKTYLENNKEEVENLIFKINEIENCRKSIENKHKNEINAFNKQINNLDQQFNLLNSNGKSSNSNIKILKNKLNIIKGEAKTQSKKYVELKKEFDSLDEESKEKDYEISLLIGQINSLKSLVNFSEEMIPEDKIDSYISKLKEKARVFKNEENNSLNNEITKNEKKENYKNLILSYNNKKYNSINTERKRGYDLIDDAMENVKKRKNNN